MVMMSQFMVRPENLNTQPPGNININIDIDIDIDIDTNTSTGTVSLDTILSLTAPLECCTNKR